MAVIVVLPGGAHAAAVEIENGTLRYTADSGESNRLGMRIGDGGDYSMFDDMRTTGGHLRIGAGCRDDDGYFFMCQSGGVTALHISLGDLDDGICPPAMSSAPLTYSGGDGYDYGGPCGGQVGVAIDNDGLADDGENRQDNYMPDVERLRGSERADLLGAGPGGAELEGGNGDDRYVGGRGDDRIHAAYVEGVGEEVGTFYSHGVDRVTCGAGADYVLGSRADRVARDCEVVGKPRPRSRGFNFRGSRKADTIEPYDAWIPAFLYGRGGNDKLRHGLYMYGGRGADRITGGGSTFIRGGPGNDRIHARGGRRTPFPDNVRCGSGRDRVYADRVDKVSDDCERVSRR